MEQAIFRNTSYDEITISGLTRAYNLPLQSIAALHVK
jgi:hypothetical protein